MNKYLAFLLLLLCLSSNQMYGQSHKLLTQIFPTPDSTAEGYNFGANIAIDGDYAVIGSSREKAAYILHYEVIENKWREIAKLSRPSDASEYGFGGPVAIEDNIIAVGGSDVVYIYEKPVEGWVDTDQAIRLTRYSEGIDTQSIIYLHFATSISISNGNVLVGSNYDAAYVYEQPASGWQSMTQTATLSITGGTERYQAGEKVYFMDTVAIVSDQWRDDDMGGIHVFRRPVSGWVDAESTTPLRPEDSQSNDRFGASLSVMPNGYLAIGASGAAGFGAVYLWSDYTKGSYTQVAEIRQPNRNRDLNQGGFGLYVSAVDHMIGVADANQDIYIYEGTENENFSLATTIYSPSDNYSHYLGPNLTLHETGVTLLIGNASSEEGGAVYAYSRLSTGWPAAPEPTQTFDPPLAFTAYLDEFGCEVAIDGDYAVVGSNNDDGNGKDNGAVYVFHHEEDGWRKQAKLTFGPDHQGRSHIAAVAISEGTIVVKLHNNEDLPLYVYQQPETGWTDMPPTAKLTVNEPIAYNLTGSALDIAGNTIVTTAYYGNESAVFIYQKKEGDWRDMSQTARLRSSIGDDASYAARVAIADNSVAVSYPFYDSKKGAILVYEPLGQYWIDMTETAVLKTSESKTRDELGSRLSMTDNAIVASVQQERGGSKVLYLFEKTTERWSNANETVRLFYDKGSLFDATAPLSITNEFIVASEHRQTFVFQKTARGWSDATGVELLFNHLANEHAISEDMLLIGNPIDDTKGYSAGTAYFYELIPNAKPTLVQSIIEQTATAGNSFNFIINKNLFIDLDDDDLSYSATLENGSPLPAWLSFDETTRTFQGQPAKEDIGSIDIKITVSDSYAEVNTTFTVSIQEQTASENNPDDELPDEGGEADDKEESVVTSEEESVVTSTDDDVTAHDFLLYPNPSTGRFNISGNEPISQITIINGQGQVIFDKGYFDNRNSIVSDALPRGVYQVQIRTKKQIATQRIVVR